MGLKVHRGYVPGCIGRVAELHASYYSKRVGFGLPFEARVAREMADFCERYQEARDGLWLAVDSDGCIQASVAIDALHAEGEGAHLRWFIADSRIRGTGLGTSLLASALAFCDAQGYRQVYLWTFEGLGAARHLYEQSGFELVLQRRGSQWGLEVDEQRFERSSL